MARVVGYARAFAMLPDSLMRLNTCVKQPKSYLDLDEVKAASMMARGAMLHANIMNQQSGGAAVPTYLRGPKHFLPIHPKRRHPCPQTPDASTKPPDSSLQRAAHARLL